MTFAPAEKFGASLPTTRAWKFRSASATPALIIWIVSPPIAFIFEWNSIASTPSPRSTRLAPALRLTTRSRSFAVRRICRSGPAGGTAPVRMRFRPDAIASARMAGTSASAPADCRHASTTASTPMASMSSKGPNSQPKPHCSTRSTSSIECAISGDTLAV